MVVIAIFCLVGFCTASSAQLFIHKPASSKPRSSEVTKIEKPRYEILHKSPSVFQVIAKSEDVINEKHYLASPDVFGFGDAFAEALEEISCKFTIKHVVPIEYSYKNHVLGSVTKMLIVIVEPKK